MALLSLIGRLGLDTSNFEGGLKKAEGSASSFAASMTSKVGGALAGAFSVAYIEQMIEKLNESAVNVSNLAKQYELTTDEVQRLQKATGKLGLDFDAVAGAIGRVQKARSMIAAGGPQGDKAADMFMSLGISKQDAANPMKSFVDLMDSYASAASKGKASREAEFELFGKSAVQVRSVMREMHNLGPLKLIDSENIKEAVDNLREAKKIEAERKSTLSPIASGYNRLVNGFNQSFNERMAGRSLLNPFAVLPSVTGSVFGGIANMINGRPSTSAPDQETEARLLEKQKQIASREEEIVRKARMKLTSASNPQAGGIGNVANLGPGNLGNIGGYFFGGNVNNAIANNTLKAAGLLTDIKKDTAAFRNLLGNEWGAQ